MLLQSRQLAEIIKPADTGLTRPYLCRLEDERTYYVKGQQATSKGLISEVVAAVLGRAFGLPIPPFCLARISDALLGLDEDARSALGSGWCFASLAEMQTVEIPFGAIGQLPRPFQQRLFLFDHWIRNEDRTRTENGGNPNLFLRLSDSAPLVIDHNLAFDAAFDPAKNRDLHVCAKGWFLPSVDLIFPDAVKGDMQNALAALEGLGEALPEEWHDASPSHFQAAIASLQEYESAGFWEPLK